MSTVAEMFDAVVGGDTHADTHTLQIAAPNGAPIADATFPATAAGHADALAWIVAHAPGPRIVVGLEGTRSYGVRLARFLTGANVRVLEVERPSRGARRGIGKSDSIDARHAVLAVLTMDTDRLPTPRADGDREALRILLLARRDLTGSRTRWNNALIALLRGGDDRDAALTVGGLSTTDLKALTRRRARPGARTDQRVRAAEATRLARAILGATTELATNTTELENIVTANAPELLDAVGVGPVSAAQTLVSFSHRGRIRNEAAFAALAGVAPLQASSGRTHRHRLNRGGDRQLNKAIHTIAVTRMRIDPRTRTYTERRRAQGMPDREIRRCLKRYIARELYRTLA